MIRCLLFCLMAFFYEATARPPNDVQSDGRSHAIDRFATIRLCRRDLSTGSSDCPAAIKRWYYDSSSQSCRSFAYTGCGGNDNRFDSRDECERICRGIDACAPSRPRHPPEGCTSFRAINIHDGCPVYHWDCQSAQRTGSCPPAIGIGPLPKDCKISPIITVAGCLKDIVTCNV